MSTQADILPHPDGTGWLVCWQTERMTEPNLWLYATREEAEQVAATFRGENVTPLPAPPEPERPEPALPSEAVVTELFCAAKDAGLVATLFPAEDGEPTDDEWDIATMEREVAAEKARQDAERAAKLAELVPATSSDGLFRPYRKRKRRPTGDQAEPRRAVNSAAFFHEVNRLHDSGVLSRAECRLMLGFPAEDPAAAAAGPWWQRMGRTA